MDTIFFNDPKVFGFGGRLRVGRLHIGSLSFHSERSYVILLGIVFAIAAVGVVAVRSSGFGRRLAAMSDSEAACATLGMNLTSTKLVLFTVSAGMAGLGGALLGGLRTGVGAGNFALLQSLVLLLLVTLGGVTTVIGALLGGVFLAGLPMLQSHLPSSLGQLLFLGTGIGAISVGRNQDGAAGQIAANLRRVWSSRPRIARPVDQTRKAALS
jgi:branched-chain amino acid transport system permease protein